MGMLDGDERGKKSEAKSQRRNRGGGEMRQCSDIEGGGGLGSGSCSESGELGCVWGGSENRKSVDRKIVDLEMAVVLENNDNLLFAMLLFQHASQQRGMIWKLFSRDSRDNLTLRSTFLLFIDRYYNLI